MIEVKKLNYQVAGKKRGKPGFALQDISFSLEQGYIMGLLGRNGSGKSTLLRLLYGMEKPDSGSVAWNGVEIGADVRAFRQKAAYVSSDAGFFYYRSLKENVELLGQLYDSFDEKLWGEYLGQCGLEEKTHLMYGELSQGEQRKFQLAFAMAHRPELLLLDEPTANLDPVFRVEWMGILQDLVAQEEVSVILSTHILSDIEEIVDYLGILREGELVLFGDRESVLQERGTMELEDVFLSVTEK